ncbi:Pro-interleukin-16 [Acipenser ruthenus]|uniref:Pro-interleukin-16 n=1 Tax=Acipenser ruthenus TaxID=7906 RepID=A0A444UWA0_ACIRT|nr:Pro-interleukin-16 [Acipenser ruthenus]
MSQENGQPDLNGSSVHEKDAPDGAPAVKDPLNVKKGPPVAPKSVWVRQSLKGLKSGKLPATTKPRDGGTPNPRSTFGVSLRNTLTKSNLSFKQKISSFETFSSSESTERGTKRIAPSLSLPLVDKPPSRSDTTSAVNTACHAANKAAEVSPPDESKSAIEVTIPAAEPEVPSSPPPASSLPSPRRSSSTKTVPSTASLEPEENMVFKSPSQRTRSFPLATTPSSETSNLKTYDGESLCKILSFSNQVSHALMRSMRSLPQSPSIWHSNPWSAAPGSPQAAPDDDLSWADKTPGSPAVDLSHAEKGFSVSLAELRECTINMADEKREDGKRERTSSLSSSASAQSLISLIPAEEIKKMIEEVKALDEETLKQFEDIHVVILHKEEGTGLGFSIAGGIDLENKVTTVHKVFPSGLASEEGTIQKGDELLSINGQSLKEVTHSEGTAILRQARMLKQAVIVICKSKESDTGNDESSESSMTTSAVENPSVTDAEDAGSDTITVELEKNAGGVGFSLEGGKGSIHGDKPLVINRIFKGGAAEQSRIQPGDELLQIQSTALQGLTRFEAWNIIKALPEGPIRAVIRRKTDQFEDIHVVILHKEEGTGLGFSIAGGIDLENKVTTVHKVFPSGLASEEGTIQKGDELLSINGQSLKEVTHSEGTAILRQARMLKQAVIVICKSKESDTGNDESSESSLTTSAVENPSMTDAEDAGSDTIAVELEKNAGGVGFSLEGGKGSIHGDKPLVINRIFKGGAAEQSRIQPGDELLQIQSTALQGLTRFEAWNIIKALPEGPIRAVIRRKTDVSKSEATAEEQ